MNQVCVSDSVSNKVSQARADLNLPAMIMIMVPCLRKCYCLPSSLVLWLDPCGQSAFTWWCLCYHVSRPRVLMSRQWLVFISFPTAIYTVTAQPMQQGHAITQFSVTRPREHGEWGSRENWNWDGVLNMACDHVSHLEVGLYSLSPTSPALSASPKSPIVPFWYQGCYSQDRLGIIISSCSFKKQDVHICFPLHVVTPSFDCSRPNQMTRHNHWHAKAGWHRVPLALAMDLFNSPDHIGLHL